MWMYSGHTDPMRLDKNSFEGDIVNEIIKIIFISPIVGTLKRKQALLLHRLVPETRDSSVSAMPVFDRWGLVPEGHAGPRDNPSPS